jgi:hypothetical protein
MSTYLSESCSRGRLFEDSTYEVKNFQRFMDTFAENSLRGIPLPSGFHFETVLVRFRDRLSNWTTEYKKMIESAEPKEPGTIKKAIRKARDEGGDSLDLIVKSLKSDDFPPILWMEISRARLAFLDSMEFMIKRMETWFRYAPRHQSQSRPRSKLTQSMMSPFLQLFRSFAQSMVDFSRMLLFIEIWSCTSEAEVFSNRHWTLRNVSTGAFEEAYFGLHQSISSLRQTYFETTNARSTDIDASKPAAWALKQMVKLVEVT